MSEKTRSGTVSAKGSELHISQIQLILIRLIFLVGFLLFFNLSDTRRVVCDTPDSPIYKICTDLLELSFTATLTFKYGFAFIVS